MPYTASSSFWTSGVPLRDLEITLPLPYSDDLPLGLSLHAFSPGAFSPRAESPRASQQLVLISGLAPGSVAEKQLRPGDILRSINGEMVGGDVSVAEALIATAPGVLRLHVLRPMNAGPTPHAQAPFDDTGFSGLSSYAAPDAGGVAAPSASPSDVVAASYMFGHVFASSRRPSASLDEAEERLSGADQAAQWRRRAESPRVDPSISSCRPSAADPAVAPWAASAQGETTLGRAFADARADGGEEMEEGMHAEDGGVPPPPLYFALLETFGG
jgi:hypothetical protein